MVKNFKKLILCVLILSGFCYWQNNSLTVSHYDYTNEKIPTEFKDYKIIQISDLHNKSFGDEQKRLVKRIKRENPDIIVITGDIADNEGKFQPGLDLVNGLISDFPIYYVPGNHESYLKNYGDLTKQLEEAGVQILDNKSITITKDNKEFILTGVNDPSFYYSESSDDEQIMSTLLANHTDQTNQFEILLSHRPELIKQYAEANVDLTFSGHAHGGQVRLPIVGGLIAPNQGLFPEYTGGTYQSEDSTLVVSRGLGNSIIPLRIFNRPDVVSLTLK